jgi:hypothetical protein
METVEKQTAGFSTVPTALGKLAKEREFPTVSTALLLGLNPAKENRLLTLYIFRSPRCTSKLNLRMKNEK